MRLLVVEDDRALVAALYDGLTAHGFAVDCVRSAECALDAFGINPYDLLVLDLGLPGNDGLTLLRKLRQRQDPIPVLILTARGALSDRVAGLDGGADDYVQKPFAFPELVARIRALLRRGVPGGGAGASVRGPRGGSGRFGGRGGGGFGAWSSQGLA